MRSKIFTRTVGYWPLQESSRQAEDYSGNENHASTTNVSSYGASGPVGSSSMEFDGSSDYVNVGSLPSLSQYTISAWVRPDSTSSVQSIFRARTNNDFNLGVENAGELNLMHSDGSSEYVVGKEFSSGNWYLVTGIWDGSTIYFYLNDLRSNSASVSSIGTESGNDNIGRHSGGKEYFDGKIAHVRVWDYPLPEASVRALYNASRGGFSESNNKTL